MLSPTAKYEDYFGNSLTRRRSKVILLPTLPVIPDVTMPIPTAASTAINPPSTNKPLHPPITLVALTASPSLSLLHNKNPKKRSLRPSLSEQLLSIGQQANQITSSLQKSQDTPVRDSPLLSVPAHSFAVGRITSRYPTPILFFASHCEYKFYHPYEASEITMCMYYAHMEALVIKAGRISFRLPKALCHFKGDYDPRNTRHVVSVQLAGEGATDRIRIIMAGGKGGKTRLGRQ